MAFTNEYVRGQISKYSIIRCQFGTGKDPEACQEFGLAPVSVPWMFGRRLIGKPN